jgi:hypothetical protein
MEKFVEDGQVAVLYSPSFGAGWSTWNSNKDIIFDKRIVKKVLAKKHSEITEEWMKKIGYKNIYCGGAEDLTIIWLPISSKFIINEYDGFESIELYDDINFITA